MAVEGAEIIAACWTRCDEPATGEGPQRVKSQTGARDSCGGGRHVRLGLKEVVTECLDLVLRAAQ